MSRLAELRESLAHEREKRSNPTQAFSAGLRVEILEYMDERCAGGAGRKRVARELGISASTLYRFSEKERGATVPTASTRPGLPRTVIPVSMVQDTVVVPRAGLSVVSPSGYRVEGLCLEEAARLLACLR